MGFVSIYMEQVRNLELRLYNGHKMGVRINYGQFKAVVMVCIEYGQFINLP